MNNNEAAGKRRLRRLKLISVAHLISGWFVKDVACFCHSTRLHKSLATKKRHHPSTLNVFPSSNTRCSSRRYPFGTLLQVIPSSKNVEVKDEKNAQSTGFLSEFEFSKQTDGRMTTKSDTFFESVTESMSRSGTGTETSPDNEPENDMTMAYKMMALIVVVASLSALDRVAMSVALVPLSEEMGYTDTMKGSISSLFSVGYGLGILPMGLLVAYASPTLIMAGGVALWSLGTIATPFAAAQDSMGFLLTTRAMVGAAESVTLPAIQRLLSNWAPPKQKSVALAIVFGGFHFGTILAYILSPAIIDQFGDWRNLFYAYGAIGLLFLFPWLTLARDSPESMKSQYEISNSMKDDVNESSSTTALEEVKTVLQSAPWKEFAQSKGVWAMFLAHAANNWGLYNSLSWTAIFYSEQYGLNIRDSAILLVIPSIVGAVCGLCAGSLADGVIRNMKDYNDEAVTNVRKAFQAIALYGPALSLATLAWQIPEDPWIAQVLLTGTVGLQAFNAAGYGAANQEKAGEKWSGLLYSITSLPSVMCGTFGVYVTGRILDYTNQDWSYVYGLNSLIFLLGGTAFLALYDSKKEFD